VSSGGVGRARERAELCEMRRGSERGLWRGSKRELGARGWASWPRILATCASVHAPVHGEGREDGTDREGPRRRERKEGTRATAHRLAARAHETEREEGRARAKQLVPTGWPQRAEGERERERERESVRERKQPLTGRASLSGGVGARPGWAELGCWAAFPFFFFSGFSNSFSISFL
jgi:hypothetical protein